MNIMILVPRVVRSYISQFPETTNNAYKYFNYDRRVVDERAEHRFDTVRAYKGPEDLTDQDYDAIVSYARGLVNPMIDKYSHDVACEDALHMAIRSYDRGLYDGKINASKYGVLLKALKQPLQVPIAMPSMVMSAKKKEEEPKSEEPVVIPRYIQKKLKIEDAPLRYRKRTAPRIVTQPGKGVIIEK